MSFKPLLNADLHTSSQYKSASHFCPEKVSRQILSLFLPTCKAHVLSCLSAMRDINKKQGIQPGVPEMLKSRANHLPLD